MKALVVDDDPVSRALLERYIRRHDGVELAASCSNAIEAANALQADVVDLVFLDIEMPEMSGLDLIRSLQDRPQVVFVSAKEEYAIEAFDVDVTDYLLKPVAYARFLKAVERARRNASSSDLADVDHIFVKEEGRLVRIDLATLHWIEAQGDYVLLHTAERDHLVSTTMRTLAERLPPDAFTRVHRSYIVRLDQIEDIEDMSIVIGRKVIPISTSYRAVLLRRLNLI